MPQSTFLEKSGALTVTGLSLQLKVRHACGTCHAYLIRYDVTDEDGVESQLDQDVRHLVELVRERANYGEYEVNGRKYYAIEIPDTNDAVTRMLSEDMPAIVLPGQQATEQDSQDVPAAQEAEREAPSAQSVQTPTQEDVQQPEEAKVPVQVEQPKFGEPKPEEPKPEEPPSLKESNQQLEAEEHTQQSPPTPPPDPEPKPEEYQPYPVPETDRAAEQHKLAAQEHDLAAQEHRLAEEQKQDEQKQDDVEPTTGAPTSPFGPKRGRRKR